MIFYQLDSKLAGHASPHRNDSKDVYWNMELNRFHRLMMSQTPWSYVESVCLKKSRFCPSVPVTPCPVSVMWRLHNPLLLQLLTQCSESVVIFQLASFIRAINDFKSEARVISKAAAFTPSQSHIFCRLFKDSPLHKLRALVASCLGAGILGEMWRLLMQGDKSMSHIGLTSSLHPDSIVINQAITSTLVQKHREHSCLVFCGYFWTKTIFRCSNGQFCSIWRFFGGNSRSISGIYECNVPFQHFRSSWQCLPFACSHLFRFIWIFRPRTRTLWLWTSHLSSRSRNWIAGFIFSQKPVSSLLFSGVLVPCCDRAHRCSIQFRFGFRLRTAAIRRHWKFSRWRVDIARLAIEDFFVLRVIATRHCVWFLWIARTCNAVCSGNKWWRRGSLTRF